jgi:Flp pilus assembly protein TadD
MKPFKFAFVAMATLMLCACKPPANAPAAAGAPPAAAVIVPTGPEPADVAAADRCFRNKDNPCALANYQGFLKQHPDDLHATTNLAVSLSRTGRHAEALPLYRKALAQGGRGYQLCAYYATSLDATGDLDGAIEWNRRALKAEPNLVDVRRDLARQLVRKGRSREAVQLLKSYDDQLIADRQNPLFIDEIAAIRAGRPSPGSADGMAKAR